MITKTGQQILGSFLAGGISTYATHIAIGCGPKPIMDGTYGDYYNKTSLDFEMFRVPITSRDSIVNEDGTTTVRLGADMPTENTFNISEIGIFSGEQNPSAGENDSRNMFAFTATEPWEFHSDLTTNQIVTALNKPITDSLDNASSPNNTIRSLESLDPTNFIPVIQTSINNPIFVNNEDRLTRYENCRFFNTAIAMPGDTSKIDKDPVSGLLSIDDQNYGQEFSIDKLEVTSTTKTIKGVVYNKAKVITKTTSKIKSGQYMTFSGITNSNFSFLNGNDYQVISESSKTLYFYVVHGTQAQETANAEAKLETIKYSSHIHLKSNINVASLTNNSLDDQIRLAFSVVNREGENTANNGVIDQPSAVRIIVEFVNNEGLAESIKQYARFEADLDITADFANNRYFVVSQKLSDLTKTSTFFWNNVNVVKVYATVLDANGLPSSEFYVFLDGMRMENVTANPLYGLTGYTVVNFSNNMLIEKAANTKNHIQFRFDLNSIDPGVS